MKREGILALDGALMWTLLQCNASPLEDLLHPLSWSYEKFSSYCIIFIVHDFYSYKYNPRSGH